MTTFIGLIIIFMALSSGSFLGANFLDRKFGEMIPITSFFIMLALYIFYIFNLLIVGFWLIIFCILLCYCVGIVNYIKKKNKRKEIIANLFTPGMIIFILFMIFVYFFTRNLTVLNYDELRLWGAYPKALYYTNKLQFGNSALLIKTMSVYPPGVALFQYFFCKCMLKFTEGYLYFAYAMLGFSIFMPLTRKMTWKKAYQIPIFLAIFILTPLSFANSGHDYVYYYKSLFIDPLLGIVFGYALFVSFNNPLSEKMKTISLILSLIALILLKDTGIVLACVCYMLFFLSEIFIFKNKNYRIRIKNLKNYFNLLIPFIVIVITFFSWSLTKKINNATDSFADSVSVNSAIEAIISPNEDQIVIRDDTIDNMKHTPMVNIQNEEINKYLTLITYTSLFVIILIIMGIIERNKKSFLYGISCFSIIFGLAVYSIAMYMFYVFGTKSVLCFGRYFSTYLMGMLIFIVIIIMNEFIKDNDKYKRLGEILIILFIFIFPINFPDRIPKGPSVDLKKNDIKCAEYSKKIFNLLDNNGEQKSIMFGGTHKVERNYILLLYHHQISLDLIEKNVKSSFAGVIDLENNDLKYNDIVEYAKKFNFDYLFVFVEDENDAEIVSSKLNTKVVESSLFKLEEKNGEYQLVMVENN